MDIRPCFDVAMTVRCNLGACIDMVSASGSKDAFKIWMFSDVFFSKLCKVKISAWDYTNIKKAAITMDSLSTRCEIFKVTLNKISPRSIQGCSPLGTAKLIKKKYFICWGWDEMHEMFSHQTRQINKTHHDSNINNISQNVPRLCSTLWNSKLTG